MEIDRPPIGLEQSLKSTQYWATQHLASVDTSVSLEKSPYTLLGTPSQMPWYAVLLPVLRVDCCYRSPQALGIFMAVREVRKATRAFRVRLAEGAWSLTMPWKLSAELAWRVYVTACISKKDLTSWCGREQNDIAWDMNVLDRDHGVHDDLRLEVPGRLAAAHSRPSLGARGGML